VAAHAPYKYNPAEMPPEDMARTFIGRAHLLDRLLAAIREQPEGATVQHYLLLGPRGIGKTTLLLMVQRRVKEDPELSAKWLCVRYREEEFYVHTLRDLLALALENLHAQENVAEADAILATADAQTDDEQSLATILSGLRKISRDHGKRILLLVDNFDLVFPRRARAQAGQSALRKILSTEPFIMVIGTSVQVFEDIATYDEAFFNFFSPVHIENLTHEEIHELLRCRATFDENERFLRAYEDNEEKVRAITHLTGGNPRLVLMLYDILSRNEFLPVVEALRETIDNLTPLLKDVLEDMPGQQSKILDTLMRLNGVASPSQIAKHARLPLNAVTTQLGRLKEARIVEASGSGRGKPSTYRVRDPMFRTWYQMRYLHPARRRIEMLVEFLRAWFAVEERTESLKQLHDEFDALLAIGRKRQAGGMARGVEYAVAKSEDAARRTTYSTETPAPYLGVGRVREVQPAFPETQPHAQARSQAAYEPSGHLGVAGRLLRAGDLPGAAKAFDQALKKDPYNPEIRVALGLCLGLLGRHEDAAAEFGAVIELGDAPKDLLAKAFYDRGMARRRLGRAEEAIADLGKYIGSGAAREVLYAAVAGLAELTYATNRAGEARDWLARLGEFEPPDTPLDRHVEGRVEIVTELARARSLDAAAEALAVLLDAAEPELRARLDFMRPALELARSEDDAVLAKLPQEEQAIARRIAARLCESREESVASA